MDYVSKYMSIYASSSGAPQETAESAAFAQDHRYFTEYLVRKGIITVSKARHKILDLLHQSLEMKFSFTDRITVMEITTKIPPKPLNPKYWMTLS